ncbi:4533_t:CDS:1 [Ambispora gerdemannii]|uniref:4533_t:CDS:1 n=1 Tax=Ambispora gerdemannii TaxID=144530 RepID=A0A9N8VNX4_9GLOM|nr:4533_t:CDS:1 [Ambispora gerdemannii]
MVSWSSINPLNISWNSINPLNVFTRSKATEPVRVKDVGKRNLGLPAPLIWMCIGGMLTTLIYTFLYRPQWLRSIRPYFGANSEADNSNSNSNNQNRNRRSLVERESWTNWLKRPHVTYNTYHVHRCERCGGDSVEPINGLGVNDSVEPIYRSGVNDSVEPNNGLGSVVLVEESENF